MSLSSSSFGNPDLREHLAESTLSAASIAGLLSGPPSSIPAEDIRASFISNGCRNRLNSSLSASDNCAFGAEDDAGILVPGRAVSGSNVRWSYDEQIGQQMLQARSLATVSPSYRVSSGSDSAWVSSKSSMISDDQYTYNVPGNELSLTLGSRQQPAMNMASVPDQCSEMSCSSLTQVTSKDNRYRDAAELQVSSQFLRNPSYDVRRALGLESRHPLPGNEERTLECGSSGYVHFSQTLLGSRYLHVAHQILAEVTGHALEDQYKPDDSGYFCERGTSPLSSDEFRHDSAEIRAHEPKTVKAELFSMLQMIDQGYNECVDQVQNVIAAFRDATNSAPTQTPARFVLHTISALYRSLRERITSQMVLLGQQFSCEFMFEMEESLESSFLQKQWALQQLRNDHQSWRPQRGLPEKSVAVLRGWMFQNFLHPYPKDNEKQLLAIKSGLTRSQVSNWFINARVRLWKPMIEEMYQEMSKEGRSEEGTGEHRNNGGGASQRIRTG
ncbi:unnamed protein product [Spirodela intermedia]|uniref:Homeobox domain-containing protein n=1 Tax=Spirodela intermedia TaxID=51605 RepID=A0A7I8KZV2_SPIIN|nr:unnamed protein product [Spirodela intermedia]